MRNTPKNLRAPRTERGATAIEYALIAALIGVVIIGGLTSLGISISATYSTVTSSIQVLGSTAGGGVAGGGGSSVGGGGLGGAASGGSGMGGSFFGP